MAGEFKHKDIGPELSRTEWEGVDTHEADGQQADDFIYYDSAAGCWKRLGKADVCGKIDALKKTGDTMTGNLTIAKTTPSVILNETSGANPIDIIKLQDNGTPCGYFVWNRANDEWQFLDSNAAIKLAMEVETGALKTVLPFGIDSFQSFFRNVDTGYLGLAGGSVLNQRGGSLQLCGCDHGTWPGYLRMWIGDYQTGKTPDSKWELYYLTNGTETKIAEIDKNGNFTPAGNIILASGKHIKLVAAPTSDQQVSGQVIEFTAGENLAFGDVCYVGSDEKMWKADADAEATMPVRYMAIATISADASGLFLRSGIVRNAAWNWTVGGLIYADVTAGALTQTAPSGSGDQVQIVGIATHADRMDFNPSPVLVEIA